jgi:hypothetical protein
MVGLSHFHMANGYRLVFFYMQFINQSHHILEKWYEKKSQPVKQWLVRVNHNRRSSFCVTWAEWIISLENILAILHESLCTGSISNVQNCKMITG